MVLVHGSPSGGERGAEWAWIVEAAHRSTVHAVDEVDPGDMCDNADAGSPDRKAVAVERGRPVCVLARNGIDVAPVVMRADVTVGPAPLGERLQVPSRSRVTKRLASLPSALYQRIPLRSSMLVSYRVPHGRSKIAWSTASKWSAVWQMIHSPSSRQTASGGGTGWSVAGSTSEPAVAGTDSQTSAASARAAVAASRRSRSPCPTA